MPTDRAKYMSKGEMKMRSIWLAAVIAVSLGSAAQAADISVLAPPVIFAAGMRDHAAAYTKETGTNVNVVISPMSSILDKAETNTPPSDVVVLPSDIMDQLQHDGGIVKGSRRSFGRVYVALAVPEGTSHPDISTPDKFIAVLKGATKGVAYDDPAGKTMMSWLIQSMLARPEFAGVKQLPVRDPLGGMVDGRADMALMLINEIGRNPKASLVGPVPPLFGTYIGCDLAVSAHSTDPKAASAFIDYVLSPKLDAAWEAKYLERD
jgi:molybdate transport system substrate-binding protein